MLGRLAALDGDVPAAVRHARDAVALARSMPSPPLLVHCLDHLADVVERAGEGDAEPSCAPRPTRVAGTAGIVRPGQSGATPGASTPGGRRHASRRAAVGVHHTVGHVRVPDSNGLGQLARLLTTPGVEVSAVELAGRTPHPVAADLGSGSTPRPSARTGSACSSCRSRSTMPRPANDLVRGERAHVEMDALLRELRRAVGLGGRDRPTGSDAERARINVARSLRRAIAAVTDQAPLLGAHLAESVRTGGQCIYLPDPGAALSWPVDERRRAIPADRPGRTERIVPPGERLRVWDPRERTVSKRVRREPRRRGDR